MLYAFIGLLFLLADQFMKFWTVAHVELNAYPGKALIPGVLNLTYIKNTGIAFGLMSKVPALRWILLALLAAFTAFIVMGLIKGYLRTGLARFSGTLLLAGLLGNGIDRAIYGYVVDMLEPKLGSITWPIFNLADCLVVVFGVLFCISLIAGGIGAPYDDYDDEEEYDFHPARRRARREEEDDEEEYEAPRRHRRVRREEEEDEEERPAPVRRPQPARPVRPTVSEKPARPAAPESDANVQVVSRPAAPKAEEKPAEPAPSAEPVKPARPAEPAAPAEPPRPVRPAAPAEAPKPASKSSDDEFDLESILAEFK